MSVRFFGATSSSRLRLPWDNTFFSNKPEHTSLQHYINKINLLKLTEWNEIDPRNFSKAKKLLEKIEGIFAQHEEFRNVFYKEDFYKNFKSTLEQLEKEYKTKLTREAELTQTAPRPT